MPFVWFGTVSYRTFYVRYASPTHKGLFSVDHASPLPIELNIPIVHGKALQHTKTRTYAGELPMDGRERYLLLYRVNNNLACLLVETYTACALCWAASITRSQKPPHDSK